jgi:hypothetical protein
MSAILLVLLLQNAPVIADPVTTRAEFADAPLALSEFTAICLKTGFDLDATTRAIAASPLHYVAEKPFVGHGIRQQRWKSSQAIVTLTLPDEPQSRGLGIPQCQVGMVSATRHAKAELLDMVRPALAETLSGGFTPRPGKPNALEWRDPKSDEILQLDLSTFTQDDAPITDLGYVISVFHEDMRNWLEAQIEAQRKAKQP